MLYDVEVVLGGEELLAFLDLVHFAFAHLGGYVADGADDVGVYGFHCELEGVGVEVVCDEYGYVVAPAGVYAGEAAAEGCFVYDVVVDEGGGVDDFEGGGYGDVFVAGVACGFCDEEVHHGAEAFASAAEDVLAYFAYELGVAVQNGGYGFFEGGDFRP